MKFFYTLLIFAIVGFSQAQKGPPKHGQGDHKNNHYAQNPYAGNYNSNGFGQGGAAQAKPTYSQLLSDSRTLNNDGTINFQYAADNGLQQGETVDADGTRRGFYSYPGADGKPLTVKYTAGKNGFIAEGDHLPKQPNVPAHTERDEVAVKYPGGGHSPQPYRPQYSLQGDSPSYHGQFNGAGASGQHQHQPQLSNYDDGQYRHKPAVPQYSAVQPSYNSRPSYESGGHRPQQLLYQSPKNQDYQGGSPGGLHGGQGTDFGPVNYGALSNNPYKHAAHIPQTPGRAYPGAHNNNNGPIHSAINPYQQAGAAGPYNGQFDLGNGGQFSIHFNPGHPQEVPIGGGDNNNYPQQQQRY